jgi:putative CocE/NonD family hydrolase
MAWVQKQSWSNGQVFQVGVSADACSLYTDFIVDNPLVAGAYATWGTAFGHETSYWGGAYVSGLVERWLDALVMCNGNFAMQQQVQQHEAYDDWWAPLEANGPYGNHFPNVKVAGIHRAGWWDIFQQQMLNTFNGAVQYSQAAVRQQQYLFVEPLGHCEGSAKDFNYPKYTINDWFNMSVALFTNDTNAAVFSRTDKLNLYVLGPVPAFLARGATYTGNYWTSVPTWPKVTSTNYYLAANGLLTTTAPTTTGNGKYTYNPKDPVPSYGGNNLLVNPCGPQDQTKQVESRADVLKFTTNATLADNLAICGQVTATLFVSSDQVDTDFTVALTDVYPDNQSVLVRYGIIRMRWRENPANLTLMTPGTVYKVTVDMWSTCHIFNAGHKIRATVTSSNSPQFDPNPNNGHLLANAAQPVYTANNVVYYGGAQASYVTLPVVDIKSIPENTRIQ